MGGAKLEGTPKSAKKSARKSAKKRSRTSVRVQQSPPVVSNPSADEQPRAPKTPVRQRRRASDFASKKSSSKKRQRNHATAGRGSSKQEAKEREASAKEDEASVDEVLQQVRELMKSKTTSAKAKALAEALKRADEAFEIYSSGSSSDEESDDEMRDPSDDAEIVVDERTVSRTPKESKKRPEITPRQQKMGSSESRPTEETASSRKVTQKEENSSGDEADPEKHKAEIEALKRNDPMFYKFLEENDGSLLDFDVSDESEQEEEPDVDCHNQQHIGDVDVEEIGNDDIQEDKRRRNVPGETDLRRDSSGKVPNAVSECEVGEDAEEAGDVDATGSDMSDESDSDGTEMMNQSKPTRNDSEDVRTKPDSRNGVKSSGAGDDVEGYSDDNDDDMGAEADAEAEAAAEAGFEVQHGSDSDPAVSDEEEVKEGRKGSKKLIFVDMKYLRELKELLKSNRSSLKACKDLLRLFRAGRDILPSSPVALDKKAKQAKGGKKSKRSAADKAAAELELEDVDSDVYKDDGCFTSGKVRFASSKSYQQAMNLAIIGIQDALDKMLGKPQRKQDAIEPLEVTWDPTDSNRWMNLEPIFRPYVFHLLALCDATEDAETLRFLLRRLEKLVPYTRENVVLLKKITRVALHVWSSDPHHIGQTTRLRSYVVLTRLAHGPGNAETVLRACCNIYASKVASVCNPKTLPSIHFATSCLVELFGIDMGASYTTAFSYLREMAISLRAVLIAKNRKQEVERIHNWSYINKLRLLSKVLGRYGSEHELRPLIYPYVQISIGVMRAYSTPRTIPLRFHVASYLSDLTADTGVFIPVVPQLLSLLRCSELRKKAMHGTTSALEWRSLLRVSDEVVKTKPFLTGLINGVVYHIAKYFAMISKHVSFPEVAHFAEVTLKKTAKDLPVAQWRLNLTCLAEKIHETGNIISDARAKADFSPHGAIHPDGMLATVPGIDKERKMPVKRFFEVEHARVVKAEKLRDEKQSERTSRRENDAEAASMEEGEHGDVEEGESLDGEEARPSKKRKTVKSGKRKKTVALSVPEVNDSDDEGDEIAELSLESDEDEMDN